MFEKIIANADVKVTAEDGKYSQLLRNKLEGSYPLKKSRDKYTILLNWIPREGLPVVEAEVDDPFPNIEFLFGVKIVGVRGGFLPQKVYKRCPLARIEGRAYPNRDYSELGITRDDVFYFHTTKEVELKDMEHMNWGKIDRIQGIDASEKPW